MHNEPIALYDMRAGHVVLLCDDQLLDDSMALYLFLRTGAGRIHSPGRHA